MKKIFLITAALFAMTIFSASAQEREYKKPFQAAEISYRTLDIYKVLDHKDAYVVMYAKGLSDIGTATVPKDWYKQSPKKLSFRPLPSGMSPYMTVIYRAGSFERVILTMPTSKANPAWGKADSNVQVDATVETLDIK